MRRFSFSVFTTSFLALLVLVSSFVQQAEAALTSAQRKEISAMKRQLGKTSAMIRRKKYDEATKIVDEIEGKVKKIIEDAKIKEKDRAVSGILKTITSKRKSLAKGQGKKFHTGLSFSKEIAPILALNCTKCHDGSKSSGNLRLDTFANMKKGGKSGQLLVKGSPNRSLLAFRLIVNGNKRMPKGGKGLAKGDITKIAKWISQGAQFDGDDEDLSLTELATGKKKATTPAKPKKKTKLELAKIKVPKATGSEKVSFKEDIAPFMVNLCLRCHSDRQKRGGLSLETVANLFEGGDSGEVIIPGNMNESRFFRLVGGLENPRMPQGQGRITRKNYEDMKTWFKEGNKYDGGDTTIRIRDLVPTEEEIKKEKMAKLSEAEFAELRLTTSHEQWKKTAPREKAEVVTSNEFYVYGNVSKLRLEEINTWATAQSQKLKDLFAVQDKLAWKGKLTIFVMKDRFSYEEFSLSVEKRQTPREVIGHAMVDPLFENAYIVLENISDDASEDSPGMKINLIQQLSTAFLMRGDKKLPDWVVRGTGFALAIEADKENTYLKSKADSVPDLMKSLTKPEEIFANNTFSPSNIGAVGASIVRFFIKGGGNKKYGRFVKLLQKGDRIDTALQTVYSTNRKKAGVAYFSKMKK